MSMRFLRFVNEMALLSGWRIEWEGQMEGWREAQRDVSDVGRRRYGGH